MDKETMDALKSSQDDTWETPQELFDFLNDIFDFALDVAASAKNAKLANFYDGSVGIDGLVDPWSKKMNWCNPPYSRPEKPCKKNCDKKRCAERGYHLEEYKPGMIDWTARSLEQSLLGRPSAVLVPVKTDTKAYKYHLSKSTAHLMLYGRVKFVGASAGALQPSMVCFMGRKLTRSEKNKLMEIGQVVEPWVPRGMFGGKK